MKRLTAALLMAVIVLAAIPALANTYVVTTGEVHIRTGPGLDYASLGVVQKGTSLVYLNESSVDDRGVTWYKLSYGDSYGWVSSRYARVDDGSGETGKQRRSSKSGGTLWATTTVNIRSGPGVGYDAIGTLEEGESARYLGNSSYDASDTLWYQIDADGGSGWVTSAYVTFTEVQREVEPTEQPSLDGLTVVVTGDRTNLRSGPGVGYAELTVMDDGDSAVFLGNFAMDEYDTVWYNVSFGDYTGWVSSRYAELW